MTARAKIRLFVEAPLGAGQGIPLNKEQSNYLFAVMRQQVGDFVLVFNSKDGEWLAEVSNANKRGGALACVEQTGPLRLPPDLWLVFAPIKKARTAFIVEKATELGAARMIPCRTRFTNERVNVQRLQAHVLEATEQCGGTFVPTVAEPVKFDDLLDDWPENRQLMFCDESRDALPAAQALAGKTGGKWAIIIGPEGGFAPEETERLRGMAEVTRVTLGPRILRADTAAVAAITMWQSVLGEWA